MPKCNFNKVALSWIKDFEILFPIRLKTLQSLSKTLVSTFLIYALLLHISIYPFSSYSLVSALQFLSTSWFGRLTEPPRGFLLLSLYG